MRVKTIWKFSLDLSLGDAFGEHRLEVPSARRAKVLHLAVQRGSPYVWILVDPTKRKGVIVFRTVGTGHTAPERGYVGTYQVEGREMDFVGHVFEVGRSGP